MQASERFSTAGFSSAEDKREVCYEGFVFDFVVIAGENDIPEQTASHNGDTTVWF